MSIIKAVKEGKVGRAEQLLNQGVCVNTEDNGFSLLLIAADKPNKDMIELLVSRGANVNHQSPPHRNCFTALHKAICSKQTENAELLISKGAPINMVLHTGWSPLHLAAHYGDRKVVQLLLYHGADIHLVTTNGDKTAAQLAVEAGHHDIAELLKC
jgi:ankyrin repeat protein